MRVEVEVEAAAEVEIRKRAERAEGKNERLTMLAPSDASHIQRAAVEAVEEGLSCALFLQLRLVLSPLATGSRHCLRLGIRATLPSNAKINE